MEHLQAYQARMKKLYVLDKFAFIDSDGLIYTSLGTQDNIDEYAIDYLNISWMYLLSQKVLRPKHSSTC